MTASMVVDARTHQPYGLLHGGASVVLAETSVPPPATCASTAASLTASAWRSIANHLRGLRSGRVTAVARPVHLGRTHVWDILER